MRSSRWGSRPTSQATAPQRRRDPQRTPRITPVLHKPQRCGHASHLGGGLGSASDCALTDRQCPDLDPDLGSNWPARGAHQGRKTPLTMQARAYSEHMFGRPNARAAAQWVRFAKRAAHEGLTIVHVVDVYQLARNGTKAVITIYGDHQARDAWFWWDRVETGATLAVAFSAGYGPHSDRDGVVFVGGEATGSGVHDRLSSKTLARAQRHQIRSAARQARPPANEDQRATTTSGASP